MLGFSMENPRNSFTFQASFGEGMEVLLLYIIYKIYLTQVPEHALRNITHNLPILHWC